MEDLIMDEVFGELKYTKAKCWGKRMEAQLFNSSGNLILVVQDNDQEGILDIQREAYKTYLQNEDKYIDTAIDYLLDYYKWNYEYIANIISGLTEEHHKDVITEKQLFEMMSLWAIYICRDGSFGYAFGCCWDVDNGLAVLLSEEEPRVISRTQLENLHKINADTIGLLVHDGKNAWKGLKKHSFFGEEENLVIELEGSVEDGITEAQKKAYAEYLQKEDELFKKFTEVLKASGTDRTALPKTLYIDKEGNYGWICYIPWFDKYTGVLLSEDTPLIFKNINQLLKYRKRNSPVVLEDFRNEERYSYGSGFVWGEEATILVDRGKRSLEEMLPLINKLVESLNNKDAFVKALIDDGMLALAEEWVSSCEDEAEDSTKERRGYMVDDETAVYLPISEKDFAASLEFDTIDISYDEKEDDISAHIFINCDPDYFADHSIEIYMDSKGNVDVIGLAG
ncbi:MAG: DUF2262 domain-containing protein [Lachnospiraceae bacterium]|nr:DUF2262 domain-containing protein [Lachnospiraceae bacterium]